MHVSYMEGNLCRFDLCLWYKDVPKSQKKFKYYIARLKGKSIIRKSGAITSFLTRDAIKKITLALGLNSSFCRGFDKILHMLLVSLIENAPNVRAKALRAVNIIVEAGPEVLCDKRVQLAVEARILCAKHSMNFGLSNLQSIILSLLASSIPVELGKKTKQMVGLFKQELLVTSIKRALALDFFPQAPKAADINPVALASVRRRCELMCMCLLEKILQ